MINNLIVTYFQVISLNPEEFSKKILMLAQKQTQ